MKEIQFMIKKGGVHRLLKARLCKGCGLIRSNLFTHQHGQELPSDILEKIKEKQEDVQRVQ